MTVGKTIKLEDILARMPVLYNGSQLECPDCGNIKLSVEYEGDFANIHCLPCEAVVKHHIQRQEVRVENFIWDGKKWKTVWHVM